MTEQHYIFGRPFHPTSMPRGRSSDINVQILSVDRLLYLSLACQDTSTVRQYLGYTCVCTVCLSNCLSTDAGEQPAHATLQRHKFWLVSLLFAMAAVGMWYGMMSPVVLPTVRMCNGMMSPAVVLPVNLPLVVDKNMTSSVSYLKRKWGSYR